MGHFRMLASVIFLAVGQKDGTGDGSFCSRGLSVPPRDLLEDHDRPSVDVMFAQAPLFSTHGNQMFGWFGVYHTALVFRQEQADGNMWYWTLEFDAVAGPLGAVAPEIKQHENGDTDLQWHSDARFCLTEGDEPLWGLKHWSHAFQTAATLTSAEVRRVFNEAVLPFNGTGIGSEPQYQLWNLAPNFDVKDVTCADGVVWVLHFIATQLKADVLSKLGDFRTTTLDVTNADLLEPVNMSNPEHKAKVVKFYRKQVEIWGKDASLFRRVFDFFQVFPMKYIHSAATGTYYRVRGPKFPSVFTGFKIAFRSKRLTAPPFKVTNASSLFEAPDVLV